MRLRVNQDFMLREIAGESVVIPTNEAAVNFRGIMSLNESGRLLWDRLQEEQTEESLTAALLEAYDTTPETAKQDVGTFLNQLREQNILLETNETAPGRRV